MRSEIIEITSKKIGDFMQLSQLELKDNNLAKKVRYVGAKTSIRRRVESRVYPGRIYGLLRYGDELHVLADDIKALGCFDVVEETKPAPKRAKRTRKAKSEVIK